MENLDEAIQSLRQLVDVTPIGHPERIARLTLLEDRLADKYSETRMKSYHDEANELKKEVIAALSVDDPERAKWLGYLAVGLWMSFSMTGEAADLDAAIEAARGAVEQGSEDDYSTVLWLSWSNTLGTLLHERYNMTGAIIDLENAIHVMRKLLQDVPETQEGRAFWLGNLACYLKARYDRTEAAADLDDAIQLARQTVEASPEDPINKGPFLHTLANSLHERYRRTSGLHDLQEAIQLMLDAVEATPELHENKPDLLDLLGDLFQSRYFETGDTDDLDTAIDTFRICTNMATIKEDDPKRAKWLYSLGLALAHRYARTSSSKDREEAIFCHRASLAQSNSPTTTRIDAGISLFQFYARANEWLDAYETAVVAVPLIPKLTPRSLQNSDKQHALSQVFGLASRGATAALRSGKGPLAALEFLEQGRGLLAASLEDMRTDILDLQAQHPRLAEQFTNLRNELDSPVTNRPLLTDDVPEPSQPDYATQRYEAGNKLDQVITEICQQPGFEDFLLVPSEKAIRAAAAYGPIVVINTSEYGCDAILVESTQIRHLPLPSLDISEIKAKSQASDLGSQTVLQWLWDVIANPILNALGITKCPSDDNDIPRVWWITTGLLARFPLHASGYHGKDSTETVLDRVMSSYSSSIKALIHGRQRRRSGDMLTEALLIPVENTPGHITRLPFVTKEIRIIRSMCHSMKLKPVEPGARKEALLAHLPQSRIFHFAGHGFTAEDPSASYLLLEDGRSNPLTVADLLELNLRKSSPFLAYLSACGTGQVRDERFTDESIHLISACQLAGFQHVVGTLWEVNDELCVDVARAVYEGIRDGGMTNESVCQGLHNASRELRDRWLSEPKRIGRGSKLSQRVEIPSVAGKAKGQGPADTFQESGRASRQVIPVDDDDGEEGMAAAMHWVPYVHFGV
ncbi:CHAT domain-containing protein [Thelonectria olida]|uniref:CHAT domain-containing protein n=1 Tax=Thelonectria olida TaxID=1576542 RepID=A0A9P8W4G9_9HYPO|nr:CHAT domain-containing protein [Thelonectria olida]